MTPSCSASVSPPFPSQVQDPSRPMPAFVAATCAPALTPAMALGPARDGSTTRALAAAPSLLVHGHGLYVLVSGAAGLVDDRCQRVVCIHRCPDSVFVRRRTVEKPALPEVGAAVPPAVRAHRVAVVGRGMRPRGFNASKASAEPRPAPSSRRTAMRGAPSRGPAGRSVPPHGR